MNDFWSQLETRLRAMEAEEEYDLFAIGYVIPQVALAEKEGGSNPAEAQDILIRYIQRSIDQDNINDRDRELIEQVLNAALEN
ncbi:hypothetical protein [Pleionea litopenaei]|uniref:YfcL protein n=1 Tax=Pleionea litopenaei TaxID=3070815 RepID=A0AA51RTQ1_9GAMM|nr:hypothetical protein [Pleionea sp. HL-JVS1]WMS87405.1 hypothetical protein Q9312_00405 [Pleionea sp. HL-JVS1]